MEMKRIVLAVSSIIISQVLPLLGQPELIIHNKNIVIMLANAAIWLTQPPVSGTETVQHKSRDKFSVLLILFFSIGSIIVSVIDWAYLHQTVSSDYLLIIGLILILFGIILRSWSIRILGKFFTPTIQIKEDHTLIIRGPYSIVRHPSYLGAWATITGAAMFFGSYIGVIVALAGMGTSYYIRIDLEEKALIEVFGQQYRNYQQKVKKIIPFVW